MNPYSFQRCGKVDKTFSGICYAVDSTVAVGRIEENAEQKIENHDDMSQSILKANAVILSNAVDKAVKQSGEVPNRVKCR